ncbi:MAG: restriction endonuclease subunit S [Leadbetterella sp.]|nr:restriction endonuclease subunit S [Leadbetterella sp.]
MNNWQTVSDFVIFSTKGITPNYVESSSILVLNQKCIRNGTINYSFAQFTDDTKQIQQSKFVQKGDILVNSTGTGTAGRCAFVSDLPENHKLTVDSHILILRCNSFFEAQCLSYSLFSFEKTLMSFMTGSSGQSELDKVVLMNLKTKIPKDEETQQKIASVLSALDSKIELNNRINAEFEAMAKTMYDYWFVQFDFPDKNGKPYKTSGGKMFWNEELKREIPEGWEVNKIEHILRTSLGGTPSTTVKEYWDLGKICWLNSGEIANFPIIDSELKITDAAIKNSATNLLPKGSVMLSITRHLRPSILGVDACANQSVVGIYEKGDIKSYFLYPYLKNEIPRLMAMRSGAQQPHINKEVVDESLILTPPLKSGILKQYNNHVGCYYDLIINNAFQNQKLTELRDWLLPMLLNGQIMVN